jgi:hypothetical protein
MSADSPTDTESDKPRATATVTPRSERDSPQAQADEARA